MSRVYCSCKSLSGMGIVDNCVNYTTNYRCGSLWYRDHFRNLSSRLSMCFDSHLTFVLEDFVGYRKPFWNLLFQTKAKEITFNSVVAIWNIHQKLILNGNLAKSHSSRRSTSVAQSLQRFAQSSTVTLPCSAQDFKTIWLLRNNLWALFALNVRDRVISV